MIRLLLSLAIFCATSLILVSCELPGGLIVNITPDPLVVVIVTQKPNAQPSATAVVTAATAAPSPTLLKVTPIAPTDSAPQLPTNVRSTVQPSFTPAPTQAGDTNNPNATATNAVIFVPPTSTPTQASNTSPTNTKAPTTANNSSTAAPATSATPTATSAPSFNADSQEQQIAVLAATDPNQHRAAFQYNGILASVARARAKDLATRRYFSHTNPDGYGPNYLVRQAGYPLPTFYGNAPDSNYIESLAAGSATANGTWQQWLNSPPHRQHVLGEISFFTEQVDYGIGYYYDPNAPYVHYWVFITARTEQLAALPTKTFTPLPIATFTNTATSAPNATVTKTSTSAAATATPITATATRTNTTASTATKTATAIPSTTTRTNTPIPATATATGIPPTATKTNTPITATRTNTPVLPTATATTQASCPTLNTALENQVLTILNNERTSRGLAPLTLQSQLGNAARNHSASMACNNFFSHTGLDGSQPWDRAQREGYNYSYIGENIAAGNSDAASTMVQWMNSQGHRDNILNPNFTQIGIGYAYGNNSDYKYYWTTVFGKP